MLKHEDSCSSERRLPAGGQDTATIKSAQTPNRQNFQLDRNLLLTFSPNSKLRPKNWSYRKRMTYTLLYSTVTLSVQFNSTTMSDDFFVERMKAMFNVGHEVSMLGTSMYLFGIAIGPMVFAPLSEMYGRKTGVLLPLFASSLLTLACSISYNLPGIFITRFFAGMCAGAPIVSTGGVLADMWSADKRGSAIGCYAICVSMGPSLGPIISSLLIDSEPGINSWRIPQWFIGLVELLLFLGLWFNLDETYEPVVLSKQAKNQRIDSGRWAIHAQQEMWKFDIKETLTVHLFRPIAMLCTPIVLLMSLYASYVFGLYYLFIANVPVAFNKQYGWTGTATSLPLLAIMIGVIIGNLMNIASSQRYGRIMHKNGGKTVPEERLPLMFITSWFMTAGILEFGWTCRGSIHFIVPCIGLAMIGAAFVSIFQACLNYLIDSFPKYSASAVGANTSGRSLLAGIFPLFAKSLYDNLGVGWGSTVIGFVSLAMIPIPFYFYKRGATIRKKNPYSKIVT